MRPFYLRLPLKYDFDVAKSDVLQNQENVQWTNGEHRDKKLKSSVESSREVSVELSTGVPDPRNLLSSRRTGVRRQFNLPSFLAPALVTEGFEYLKISPIIDQS